MNDLQVNLDFNGESPERLDKFLVQALPEFSRSRIQSWIKQGLVTVEGQVVRKSGFSLQQNSVIGVLIPSVKPSLIEPEEIPLDIVYEDGDVIVVNKPAGMVVHPSAGHTHGTLVHAALAHAPEMAGVGGVHRPGVVHRLDKNTSGLILLAKNDVSHRWLQNQFRNQAVEKSYLALVDGRPPTKRGRIEAAIGRDLIHRKRMAIQPPEKGRSAVSEYRTVETFTKHTLLEVQPITGRTHQIRVHLAYLKCPIVGDRIYGLRKSTIPINRHFLHAASLTIRLPQKKVSTILNAPLPDELEVILSNLRDLHLNNPAQTALRYGDSK